MRAIAESNRRAILRLVWEQELSAGDISSHFAVSRPAISQHLRVLRSAGLLDARREGTRRLYRARAETLAELRDFLEGFWEGRLTLLKHAAEDDERRRRSSRGDVT